MPAILRSLPRARLAIAGTGSSDSSLREQVTHLALEDRVRFVGRISDSDLVNSYRTADLVVMPSQALEGFGLTTAEALACGTPVVGTPIGATPELLAGIDPCARGVRCNPGRHRGCGRRRPERFRARRRYPAQARRDRRRRAFVAERRTPVPRGIQAILGSPRIPLMPSVLAAHSRGGRGNCLRWSTLLQ